MQKYEVQESCGTTQQTILQPPVTTEIKRSNQ